MSRYRPFVFLFLLSNYALAFEIDGSKWPGATTDFYISLDGISAAGIQWNTAFIEAVDEWNDKTDFTFRVINEAVNPCGFDILNGVDFAEDVCGTAYGANTLAVTLRRFNNEILGPPKIVESDIVINTDINFEVFDGPLFQFGRSSNIDFRRVALHELGHALGLEHEEEQSAIMAPNISNLDSLRPDDIEGVNTLYGGLSNCASTELKFGQSTNSLSIGDCVVSELTVGGGDTSFVDLYRFEISQVATLEFKMTSPTVDSVLVLATAGLEFLNFDDKTSGLCESNLSATLQPGSYLLLTNTYDVPVQDACGNTGNYVLQAAIQTPQLQALGPTLSFQGSSSEAQFSGGVTANNGVNYSNVFSPDESLDIEAEISIGLDHTGLPGFLVVAALIDTQVLFLNSAGEFIASPANQIISAKSKPLESVESLIIASNLVPSELGIEEIEVDFFIGYGLTSNPDEIYYHGNAINLLISP